MMLDLPSPAEALESQHQNLIRLVYFHLLGSLHKGLAFIAIPFIVMFQNLSGCEIAQTMLQVQSFITVQPYLLLVRPAP